MKILNLYAGIGGNRKLWGDDHEITAVEFDPKIAAIYQDFWKNDTVIVADAHKYLEDHYKEFDFIWSSPPCPTHSRVRKAATHQNKPMFPDMKLYEEILFLKGYFKGKWCVENVISWYDPLITPQKSAHHYFWTNFLIPSMITPPRDTVSNLAILEKRSGFNIRKYKGINKIKALRNCVEPEVGKQILEYAINPVQIQKTLL